MAFQNLFTDRSCRLDFCDKVGREIHFLFLSKYSFIKSNWRTGPDRQWIHFLKKKKKASFLPFSFGSFPFGDRTIACSFLPDNICVRVLALSDNMIYIQHIYGRLQTGSTVPSRTIERTRVKNDPLFPNQSVSVVRLLDLSKLGRDSSEGKKKRTEKRQRTVGKE